MTAAPISVARDGLKRLLVMALASDPALARLRMATRVTLTLLVCCAALAGLHAIMALPTAAYGVAIITAMQGALAVRDASVRARAVTRLYCGLAGFLCVALASFLSSLPFVADAFFIMLVFPAVYARKYGARWNAVGMFAFMCTFMGIYMHPAPADLPAVALALVVSAAIAHLVRNRILPENREADLGRALAAIGVRVTELQAAIADGDASGWAEPQRRRAIGRQERITDTVLIAEGYLPLGAIDDTPERRPLARLAVALFDLHLASETAVMSALRGGPAVTDRRQAGTKAALTRLGTALRLVREAVADLPAGALDGDVGTAPAPAPSTAGERFIRDPALRLAIQVTLASAVAMTGGLLLSKTRFFWAILTAFLVFTNTQSRGDTAMRAMGRAGGTLVGIAAGIGLATLLGGAVLPSIGLAILFVFTGFYLLQVSYAAMTFFVTLVLALLYGLLGEFTPGLLVLRLEETMVGVAAGVFIAFVVFPQSTSASAGSAVEAFLADLDALLAAAADRIEGRTAPHPVALSRGLDRRYADLALAARPLGTQWQIVQKPGRIRQMLLRFMAMAHWSRILARALSGPRAVHADTAETRHETLLAAIAALRAQVAEAKASSADILDGRPLRHAGSRRPEPLHADFDARSDEPLFALDVLSHILDRIAHGGQRLAGLAAAPEDPQEQDDGREGRRRDGHVLHPPTAEMR